MNDLLPDDDFDARQEIIERHSRYASLLMLIILIFLFWLSITPISNYETSADNNIYQEDGVIEDLGRYDDHYFAIVRFEHDGEMFRKSIDISYTEFINYRENQKVQIKAKGNSYYIVP